MKLAAGASGGPLQSGLFYMLYIYNRSFETLKMGYGSALAWIMTVLPRSISSPTGRP